MAEEIEKALAGGRNDGPTHPDREGELSETDAEKVTGGASPGPAGPVPIPYPNFEKD